jgi:hypothetical protein
MLGFRPLGGQPLGGQPSSLVFTLMSAVGHFVRKVTMVGY